jgi:hypothetical protein
VIGVDGVFVIIIVDWEGDIIVFVLLMVVEYSGGSDRLYIAY